jgi:hypothetical protein
VCVCVFKFVCDCGFVSVSLYMVRKEPTRWAVLTSLLDFARAVFVLESIPPNFNFFFLQRASRREISRSRIILKRETERYLHPVSTQKRSQKNGKENFRSAEALP